MFTRDLTTPELRFLATGKPQKLTADYYASAIDEAARAAKAKLTEARRDFVMAEEVMNEVPVMEEMERPRETHILARGQYDSPTNDDTKVRRDTFSDITLPFPEDAPRDRRGLAQWVTDPNHPLTARVAVNRLWGNFFESPLVRTPENFGSQGELPSHPELLDFLASWFVESGWDTQALQKPIFRVALQQLLGNA